MSISETPDDGGVAVRKEKAARVSMFASAGLAVLKLAAGIASGSLALLSDALHALIDLGATTMTWLAIRVSDQPADDNHHYGHGKVEAVVALVETGLLLVLAIGVAILAASNLSAGGHQVEHQLLVFAVLGISVAVDLVRWRSLARVARETDSEALAADALHFSSDLVSSLLVAAGMAANAFGFRQGDALAAIGVALFIGIAGYRLGKRTIDTLMDVAPRGVGDDIQAIAAAQRGVADVERVRVRRVGATLFADLEIGVARTLSSERLSEVRRELSDAIAASYPGASVTIVPHARALDSESVLERVLLIAANRRMPIHHVTVQEVEGRLSISLDLELDGRLTLGAAHAMATKLETAIRDAFGPDTEVESHIEPLDSQELVGRDASAAERAGIIDVIEELLGEIAEIGRAHDVRVRETARGSIVNMHVDAAAETPVWAVHRAVDELERRAKERCPAIHRIVTHAEPVRSA